MLLLGANLVPSHACVPNLGIRVSECGHWVALGGKPIIRAKCGVLRSTIGCIGMDDHNEIFITDLLAADLNFEYLSEQDQVWKL